MFFEKINDVKLSRVSLITLPFRSSAGEADNFTVGSRSYENTGGRSFLTQDVAPPRFPGLVLEMRKEIGGDNAAIGGAPRIDVTLRHRSGVPQVGRSYSYVHSDSSNSVGRGILDSQIHRRLPNASPTFHRHSDAEVNYPGFNLPRPAAEGWCLWGWDRPDAGCC